MPPSRHSSSDKIVRLLKASPLRFVCAWSQETTLRACPMHDHVVAELVYHPTGAGVTTLADGTRLTYTDGGVVFYSAHVAHDQTPTQPGSDVCVHVEIPKPVAALLPPAVSFSPLPDPYVSEEFWSLSRTPPQVGDALRAVLDLRATALLLRLLVADGQHDQFADAQATYVQRARHFIQENFATSPDVAFVAAHVGVSPDYLRHLFQQREGTTINRVLTRVRIERAKELLRHSRLPLKDIAAQCGFQTDRYFCTRFAAAVGLTPGEFRNQPHGPKPPPLPGEDRIV